MIGQVAAKAVQEDVDLERETDLEIIELGAAPAVILEPGKEVAAGLVVLAVQRQGLSGAQQVDALVQLTHPGKRLHHGPGQARVALPGPPAKDLLHHAVSRSEAIVGDAAGKALFCQAVVD